MIADPGASQPGRPPRYRAGLITLVAAVCAVAILVFVAAGGADQDGRSRRQPALQSGPSSAPAPGHASRSAQPASTIGYSVDHRAIRLIVIGDPRAPQRTLVVGCIHGNETAGIAVARRLTSGPLPAKSALWIIPDLNPDGVAAGTRQNAHGVDLNRNFPYRWRRQYAPGDLQYAGPRALSEPESRLAHALILRLRPSLTIWFHQPEGLTDRSGGDVRLERRFAELSGLPLHQLTRYRGSATSWQNHRFPHSTAFVVELPPGRPSKAEIGRYAHAVLSVARAA